MNKDIAEKWVAALRSGKYKQGVGKLKRGDSHCCLGVLCEILEIPQVEDNDIETSVILFDGSSDLLPKSAIEKASMKDNDGTISSLGFTLWELNDGSNKAPKHNFMQISDLIEKHYEKL